MDLPVLRSKAKNRQRKSKHRRTILFAGTVTFLLALGALYLLPHTVPVADPHVAIEEASAGASALPAAYARGQVYKYSVIPGGVRDHRELQRAIDDDPVVAAHYRNVTTATMRAMTVPADRLAYVSYRLGDNVYWTRNPVRIRSGETILGNGQIEIRARCGNCISLQPLQPTSDNEPAAAELDALTDDQPLLVSWNLNPFGMPAAPDSSGLLPLTSLPLVVFPFGPFSSGTPGVVDGGSGAPPPFGVPGSGGGPGSPGVPVPPPFGVIPGGDVPFGPVVPPGGPSAPPTLVLTPLLDNPDVPEGPPLPPPDATPVPEPMTLWLVGSGLAGVLAHRWRSRG